MIKSIIGAITGAVLLSLTANSQSISYELSMPEPHTHYFEVDMHVNDHKTAYFDIKMPVWAPGSYLIREFAKSVEDLSAKSDGKALEVKKINKNTWRIFNKKKIKVDIHYKVYAFELSVRTSFIDMSHGYINGTSVFMYLKDNIGTPGTLTVKPYKDWKEISTGMPIVGGNKWKRSFENYDILVDSPIEIGNQEIFHFDAAGVKHTVAMYGQGNYEVEKLKKDMSRVVESCTNVFGFNPNKEYTFIIHNLTHGSGGLEHLNSTTLQVNRWTYGEKKYNAFLSLVAHEYFHLWNVKRIRPVELGPFNYDEENYTSLLWIMEGFTSYYDELLLMRSGFYDEDLYLNKLTGTITRVENQPGNKVLPLSESSLDAWIKLYRPNENSYNTTISYYSKGSLVAAMLDLEIIASTQGEKSLDDVLIYLYETYYNKAGRGFNEAEAKAAIEKVAGKKMDDFFNQYIYGTETIDYNAYFKNVGIEIKDLNKNKKSPSLGVQTKDEKGRVVVSSVVRNTTAYMGGINAKDEILAINGNRVSNTNLKELIALNEVGSKIKVLIARDGIVTELEMPLMADPSVNYTMSARPDIDSDNRRNLQKWLIKK